MVTSACLLRLKPVGDAQPEILPEKQLKLACPNFRLSHQWELSMAMGLMGEKSTPNLEEFL